MWKPYYEQKVQMRLQEKVPFEWNHWKKWRSQASTSENILKRGKRKCQAQSMLGWNMVANMVGARRITPGEEKVTDNRVSEAIRLCRSEKGFSLLSWERWKAIEGFWAENWHSISSGLMGLLWLLFQSGNSGRQRQKWRSQVGSSYNNLGKRWWWLEPDWWQLG